MDRLLGTHVAVANLELRVPLFGPEILGLVTLPWLPTDVGVFADAGVAWTMDDPPVLRFETGDDARLVEDRIPTAAAGRGSGGIRTSTAP